MIKTEKPAADSDEMLLESLLQPVVTDERASDQVGCILDQGRKDSSLFLFK